MRPPASSITRYRPPGVELGDRAKGATMIEGDIVEGVVVGDAVVGDGSSLMGDEVRVDGSVIEGSGAVVECVVSDPMEGSTRVAVELETVEASAASSVDISWAMDPSGTANVSPTGSSEKWTLAQLPIKANISCLISRILPASFSSIIHSVNMGTSMGKMVNLFKYFFVFNNLYFARLNFVFCSIPK